MRCGAAIVYEYICSTFQTRENRTLHFWRIVTIKFEFENFLTASFTIDMLNCMCGCLAGIVCDVLFSCCFTWNSAKIIYAKQYNNTGRRRRGGEGCFTKSYHQYIRSTHNAYCIYVLIWCWLCSISLRGFEHISEINLNLLDMAQIIFERGKKLQTRH